MQVNIRVAVKEDCPRLMELVNELALYEKAPQEVSVTLQEFEDAGFGDNPVWKSFVAEVDGMIVGFGLYYVRYSTWKGCRMYIEDLLVTGAMRGKGIGKLIFDELVAEAKALGFNGITWQVLDWNEPAIGFYRQFGTRFDDGWTNCHLDFRA